MLVREVLGGLGEPRGRVALQDERDVVAGAQEAVAALDRPDVHARGAVVGHFATKRPSCRDGPSFSPPMAWRIAACCGRFGGRDAFDEQPDRCGSRVPSSAVLVPTMSLLNMPWTSAPAAFICLAMKSDP